MNKNREEYIEIMRANGALERAKTLKVESVSYHYSAFGFHLYKGGEEVRKNAQANKYLGAAINMHAAQILESARELARKDEESARG